MFMGYILFVLNIELHIYDHIYIYIYIYMYICYTLMRKVILEHLF